MMATRKAKLSEACDITYEKSLLSAEQGAVLFHRILC